MVDEKGKDRRSVIVLDDSDDDEEEVQVAGGTSNEVKPVNSMAAIGDRALMEKERLERQKKRRREAGLPEEEEESKGNDRIAGPSSKVQKKEPQKVEVQTENRANGKEGQNIPLYWSGTIKKSFNIHSKSAPGTPFEEFLRPTTPFRANGLTHVIMATFCEDIQWLSQMFPKGVESAPEITMITLAQEGLKAGVYAPLHPQLPNWIRLVVPRRGLNEYTTMHMKFIILFYKDRLRLMILSGNLVDYDWRRIENTAFIHDFPRLKNDEKDTTSEYGKQMRRILSSLSVPSGHHAMQMMETYDMSSKCEAKIVASIPTFTPVTGWAAIEELGIGRLGKVVREILGDKMVGVDIEAQGSSMGSYSPRWLQQFHLICTGADYKKHLPLPTGAKAVKAWASATNCKESEQWPPIKLLFPSDAWVKTKSVEGINVALTFFGKKKVSIEKGFIQLIHQPVSLRGNIMMHHKAIVAIKKGSDLAPITKENPDEIIGWAYMGSHNLTQAAWGNISSGKKGGEVQLSINNWELGIVVPMRSKDLLESQKPLPESMKANIITWKRPVEKYKDEDVPWDQFDQR